MATNDQNAARFLSIFIMAFTLRLFSFVAVLDIIERVFVTSGMCVRIFRLKISRNKIKQSFAQRNQIIIHEIITNRYAGKNLNNRSLNIVKKTRRNV